MPIVRLSGTVIGSDDPGRSIRAKLLFLLYNAGWDIYNSNGDQQITLSNIEKKISESDAFVFTPGASSRTCSRPFRFLWAIRPLINICRASPPSS